jgi:hypothetical protein
MYKGCWFLFLVLVIGCGSGDSGDNSVPVDTTAPVAGSTCPLGTWSGKAKSVGCDGAAVTGITTITKSPSGTYIISSSYSKMNTRNANGDIVCDKINTAATAELFNNNTLTYPMSADSNTCPQKTMIMTMTFSSDCLRGEVSSITSGCNICDANGDCSGCGSAVCTSPAMATFDRVPD